MSENLTDEPISESISSWEDNHEKSQSPSDLQTSNSAETIQPDGLIKVKQEPMDLDDTEHIQNTVQDNVGERSASSGSSPAVLDHTAMDGCSPPVSTTRTLTSGEDSSIQAQPSMVEQEEEMMAMRRDLDRGAAYQNKEFRLSDYRVLPEPEKNSSERPSSAEVDQNSGLDNVHVDIKEEPSDVDSCSSKQHKQCESLSQPEQRPASSILASRLGRPPTGNGLLKSNSFTVRLPISTPSVAKQPSITRSLTVTTTTMKPVAVLVPVSIPVGETKPGSVVTVRLPTTDHLPPESSGVRAVLANGNSLHIPIVTMTTSSNGPIVSSTLSTRPPTSLADRLQAIHEKVVAEIISEWNVIPRYTTAAVPDKFKDRITTSGFSCRVCSDKFLFKSGLETHLKRMSMQIKYRCDVCLKSMGNLIFTNKCAFLTHVKSHGLNPSMVKSSDVSISPLSSEMMDNIVDMVVTESDYENASSDGGSNSSTVSKKVVWKCVECTTNFDSSFSLAKHFDSETATCKLKCPHCEMFLPEPCALMAHQRIHKHKKPYVCPECGLVVQGNSDIFNRHLEKCCHFSRMLGYKCPRPRCPMMRGSFNDITVHMLNHKETYYKCQHCPMAFKSETTIKSHMDTAHVDSIHSFSHIYKCSLCDTVFHSLQQLSTHTQQHVKTWMDTAKFVFKCLHCSKLFEGKAYLCAHMTVEHKVDLDFLMCEICGNKYKTILQLNHHLATHADIVLPPLEKMQRSVAPSIALSVAPSTVKGKLTKQNSELVCEYCGDSSFIGEAQLTEHFTQCRQVQASQKCLQVKWPKMKKPKGKDPSMFLCSACKFRSPLKSMDDIISHIEKHREEGVFICSCCITAKFENLVDLNHHEFLCRKGPSAGQKRKANSDSVEKNLEHPCSKCPKSFAVQEQLVKHLKSQHGVVTHFPCHLCGLMYDTRHSLQHHIRVHHEGKKHMYLCWICQSKNIKRTFTKRFKLEKHLISKHRIPKNIIDPDKFPRLVPGINDKDMIISSSPMTPQGGDTTETPIKRLKVAGDTTFNCAKCQFSTDDAEKFRSHITEHKAENDSQQCPECGLCFSVLPSLKKHLRMVHKIKDVPNYLKDHCIEEPEEPEDVHVDVTTYIPSSTKLYTPKVVAPVAKVESGNPLECTVCYRDFASEAILKSHMRTHGMAFIRSKRSIAAAGSDTSSK